MVFSLLFFQKSNLFRIIIQTDQYQNCQFLSMNFDYFYMIFFKKGNVKSEYKLGGIKKKKNNSIQKMFHFWLLKLTKGKKHHRLFNENRFVLYQTKRAKLINLFISEKSEQKVFVLQ